jgi:hypothetical protein
MWQFSTLFLKFKSQFSVETVLLLLIAALTTAVIYLISLVLLFFLGKASPLRYNLISKVKINRF